MKQDFHFKNMLPPAEVLPDGVCESRCLMEDLAGQFAKQYRDADLSRSSVADAIGISPCHLSSLFHEETGQTFHDHVKNLRFKAQELMETTNLPLSEVAWRSGFSTARNLHRSLRPTE